MNGVWNKFETITINCNYNNKVIRTINSQEAPKKRTYSIVHDINKYKK